MTRLVASAGSSGTDNFPPSSFHATLPHGVLSMTGAFETATVTASTSTYPPLTTLTNILPPTTQLATSTTSVPSASTPILRGPSPPTTNPNTSPPATTLANSPCAPARSALVGHSHETTPCAP